MSSLWRQADRHTSQKGWGEEASGAGFELLERLNGRRNSSCSRVGSASTGPRPQRSGGPAAMSGNVLWTTIFNEPTSQATELTRDRIRQHDRVGRRPASIVPGPLFEEAIRGRDTHGLVKMDDPWVPPRERHSLPPPLVGYGGTFPRVRPEHTGKNMGEQAAQFMCVQPSPPARPAALDDRAYMRAIDSLCV